MQYLLLAWFVLTFTFAACSFDLSEIESGIHHSIEIVPTPVLFPVCKCSLYLFRNLLFLIG